MFVIPFMTAAEFARLSKMGVKQIKARMDIGEIPEIANLREGGVRYVDCITLADRLLRGEVVFSDLSKEGKDHD
ncbi:hypothetical protein [Enterovibrio coralii]|uniref:DNA-binding protein n=1 Tax=Enterovibrio coralii TaxID=294935 RepID=A0A135I750_9GAMM|nr:hypothetical protein [Enterovibrio coralii]KXF81214.1 hypothetical protein ATN88_00125 [Enterovibrio coralii]